MITIDGNNVRIEADPDKIVLADLKNKEACKNYRNCISGVFQYANKPNAIFVYGGKVLGDMSAHAWLGYPDTCLICYNDGRIVAKRLSYIPKNELSNIRWAVSGVGLLDMYNPTAEGYAKIKHEEKIYDYSDVLRKTNHTALGITKTGKVVGMYLSNMTAQEVNAYCKKQNLCHAIMLDGGHIAAVNCDTAKKNESQKQSTIIQFVLPKEQKVQKYSRKKDGEKQLTKNFKVREFACHDGTDEILIYSKLPEILQKIRAHFGCAVVINSGYRTPSYNKKVGGVSSSQHILGSAADIVVKNVSPKKVAAYAETLLKNTGGIGIYTKKGFTHIDVREKIARWSE